jgi:putative Mg2+ transporter-C (MgtC) family protein
MNPASSWEMVTALVTAGALAGLLGLDREVHGRWAGLRTHILVALGCCTFVLAGRELTPRESSNLSRVIQGIATGIGFIGAGTILKLPSAETVRGLTTASTIWLAAAAGTACGLELYALAITGTVLTLIVLIGLGWMEHFLGPLHKKPEGQPPGSTGQDAGAGQR